MARERDSRGWYLVANCLSPRCEAYYVSFVVPSAGVAPGAITEDITQCYAVTPQEVLLEWASNRQPA